MSNPIIEDLLWRRTAKKYDASKKVSQEDLDLLFEAIVGSGFGMAVSRFRGIHTSIQLRPRLFQA